jgi:hypothetical protein
LFQDKRGQQWEIVKKREEGPGKDSNQDEEDEEEEGEEYNDEEEEDEYDSEGE